MQAEIYEESFDDTGTPKSFLQPWQFWCLGFVYACLLALMFQKLILPLMPEMHAGMGLLKGDALWFHTQAAEIAKHINANGWSKWSLFPPGATGNVGILSALYALFGPNPASFIPVNAAAHATGALLIYMIGPLLWRGRVGALGGLVAATLFILFPSGLQWYGQNHKDSFAIAGILLMLYVWLRIWTGAVSVKKFVSMLALGLTGSLLLAMVRPYMPVIILVAFMLPWFGLFLWSLFSNRLGPDGSKLIQSFLLVAVIACVAGLSATIEAPSSTSAFGEFGATNAAITPIAATEMNWQDTHFIPTKLDQAARRASELRAHFVRFSKAVGAGSSIDQNILPNNFWDVIVYMPRAVVVGLFAPFPSTWTERVSAPRLVGAIETSIWYVLFIGVVLLAYNRPSRAMFSAIVFAAFIVAVLSYVQPNVGNLYRQRFGLWMFVLLCGSIGWASLILPFFDKRASPEKTASRVDTGQHLAIGNSSSIAASGSVVVMITFLCYLGFMARDILLASTIGMNSRLDAFFSATMIPMFFVTFLSMPLADAMMLPFFKAEPRQIQATARNVLWLATVVLGCTTILIIAFARPAVGLVLKDLSNAELLEATQMLRLFAPIVLLSAWTVVGNAVLNALHRSTAGALAQMVVPAVTLIAIIAMPKEAGIQAAIAGMLAGTFINVILVVICAWRAGILLLPARPGNFDTLGNIVKSYRLLAIAAIFTAALSPMNFMFAGTVGAGTVSAWALSNKIVLLFNGLASIGISAVLLPHFARLIVHNGIARLRNQIYFLLVAGSWIGGATALAIFEFADPLANVLFSSNAASRNHIEDIANVIRTGALQLPILIAAAVIMKMAAVSGASTRAVIAAALGLVINLVFNLALVPVLGVLGIALGALMGAAISTAYLAIATRRLCGFAMKEVVILIVSWVAWGSACGALVYGSQATMLGAVFGLIALGWAQWKVAKANPAL